MLSFLLAAAVVSAGAASSHPEPGARDNVTISGTVVSDAGTPLAEVRVAIVELNRQTTTDQDGRYRFTQVPTGSYSLSFALVGYIPQVRRVLTTEAEVLADATLTQTRIELPPIQVTATPGATNTLTSPQPATVIGGPDLAARQNATLGATLDGLPGVHNWSTGAGIGKPVIRGLSSNRVLVVADGQRLESQQWGDEHAPNISTADAARIEVIRGPASVLYGSDAIGGVVNVVRRDLPEAIGRAGFVRGTVTASYATNTKEPAGAIGLEGASGGVGFRAALEGRSANDVRTPDGPLGNSGNESYGGQGTVGVQGGWGSMSLDVAHRKEEPQIHEDPAEESDATPFQRITENRGHLRVQVPIGLSRLEVSGGVQQNFRREFEEAGATDVALGLKERNVVGDARIHHGPIGNLFGTVGATYRRTTVDISGEEALVPASTSDNIGLFAFEQLEAGRWHLAFGARYDHRTLDVAANADLGNGADSRSYGAVTGNIGVSYMVAEPVALVVNVGRGFRAPSAFELFANGVHEGTARFEVGDPTLGNETSVNTDLSVRIQTQTVRAEVGGYVNVIQDYIFPDPTGTFDPESGFEIFNNTQGDARFIGFEAAGEVHATPYLHLSAGADYVRAQNTTRDSPLPFIPPLRITYSARLEGSQHGRILSPYFEIGGGTNAKQTRLDPEDVAPDGYTLAHVAGGLTVDTPSGGITVDLVLHNAFNTSYASFLSRYKQYALDMGRNLTLRVSTAF